MYPIFSDFSTEMLISSQSIKIFMFWPSDILRQLAARGRELRARAVGISRSKRDAHSHVSLGVDILDAFFDLSGYKRTASRLGRIVVSNSLVSQARTIGAEYNEWNQVVGATLANLYIWEGREGNASESHSLKEKFDKTQRYAKIETNLRHGIDFLEVTAEQKIVSGSNLEQMKMVNLKVDKSLILPESAKPVMEDGENILQLLEPFPSEKMSIEGALSVLKSKIPDYGRITLASCRNTLENLVKGLAGEGDWVIGLTKLVPHETQRKIIRQSHSYLSAYGTHASAVPSDDNIEVGFKLTFVAIRLILSSLSDKTTE
jgi:hypothetical protein